MPVKLVKTQLSTGKDWELWRHRLCHFGSSIPVMKNPPSCSWRVFHSAYPNLVRIIVIGVTIAIAIHIGAAIVIPRIGVAVVIIVSRSLALGLAIVICLAVL